MAGGMTRRDVRFPSGDGTCAGWLFDPPGSDDARSGPIVVLGHGLGGVKEMRLDDYRRLGSFDNVRTSEEGALSEVDRMLCEHLGAGRIEDFIRLAVVNRYSILLSGGTSSGKRGRWHGFGQRHMADTTFRLSDRSTVPDVLFSRLEKPNDIQWGR